MLVSPVRGNNITSSNTSSEDEFLMIYRTAKQLQMGFGSLIKTHIPWCLCVDTYIPMTKKADSLLQMMGTQGSIQCPHADIYCNPIYPRIPETFIYNLRESHELLESQLDSR